MKKLFIQCVMIVMCFSIFSIEQVSAAPTVAKVNCQPYYLLEWISSSVPCTKYTYPDGTYAISRDDRGVTDFYDAQGKKVDTKMSVLKDIMGLPSAISKTGSPVTNLQNNGANQILNNATNAASAWVKEIAYGAVYYWAQFMAWIVGGVGKIFDNVLIAVTPTGFSDAGTAVISIVSLLANGGPIESSWKIIRDLASIVLIFSLLYLGIKTILDGNGFADKKSLVSIIIAAILLNFSLLLVRDVGFFVSNRIGREILETAVVNNTTGGMNAEGKKMSFSEAMLNMVGPQSLFKTQGAAVTTYNPAQFSGMSWGAIFMFIMQTAILTFVLITATLVFVWLIGLLLVRFIIFVMLMITAPLAVIASTVPWLKSQGKMWTDEFKKQIIFFPAFVFTMYIVFLLIGTIGSGAAIVDIAFNATGFADGAVKFFFNFALIIGFMVVLLIIPGKISQGGVSLMGKATQFGSNKIRSFMGRTGGAVAFGGAASLGRNTIGRIASRTLSSDKIKSASQNEKGIKGMAARALLRGSDKAQNMSFDARSTKFGGELAKKYNLGTASAGWKGTVDNKVKAYKAKQEKEMKLFGFGEDLPNADKSRAEIKNMEVRDNLKKSIEADKRKITELEGTGDAGDKKKAKKIAEKVAEKEAKLATVYTNLDTETAKRTARHTEEKAKKQLQITNAQALHDKEKKKLEEIEKLPESAKKANQIKIQKEAVALREKEVQELKSQHDAIGVSPKQKHAQELAIAKATRDNKAKEFKDAEKKLQEAQKSGDQNKMNEAIKEMETHQKALGELETEVGRLMNRGADQYLKFAEAQRKSLANFKGISQSGKAAMEKVAKETKKSWQEKGKANVKSEKNNKKDTTATNTTPASTPAPGSTASNNLAAADSWAGRHS